MDIGNLLALIQIVEALGSAGAGKDLGITEVTGQLVDRCQAGTAGNRHNFGIFRRCCRYPVGTANVDLGANRQVHHRMGKFTHIDYRQLERIVAEGGEGLFTQARNPEEDKLAGLDINLAVKGKNADILTDALVFHQHHRLKVHINIVANMAFGFIGIKADIRLQLAKVAGHIVGGHAGQGRADTDNG